MEIGQTIRQRRVLLAFVAVGLLMAIAFSTLRDDRGRTARLTADAWYYHAYLPSLVLDHDLDFQNQYKITGNWYRFGKAFDGRPKNVFGVGPAVFEMPLFAIGHGLARILGQKANGFSAPEVYLSLLASVLATLGALVFAFRLLRRRLDLNTGLSFAVPALVACGSPVIYYAIRQPGYAHPFAAFFVVWLVDHWDSGYDERPRSFRHWLGLGALLGAATLARPQLAVWGLLLGFSLIDDFRILRRIDSPRWRVAVGSWFGAAVVALAVFSPQLLAWKAQLGTFGALPQGEGFMWWSSSAWVDTLFSSRNGLFPWSPLVAIAVAGLGLGIARMPRVCVPLALVFLVQAFVNGAAWDWWAGGSFGARRFDSCFVVFCVGLGVCASLCMGLRRLWLRRIALLCAAGLCLSLAIGNLQLLKHFSAPTVPIQGGRPAAAVMERSLAGPFAYVAAVSSRLVTLPTRAVFALRHSVSLRHYDVVVGKHWLGETYPGLNSRPGSRRARVPLDPSRAYAHGFSSGGADAVMRRDEARVLLGFNRRGPVSATIEASGHGQIEVAWNSQAPVRSDLNESPQRIVVDAPRVNRGLNTLTIRAPAGTRVRSLIVTSATNAAGEP